MKNRLLASLACLPLVIGACSDDNDASADDPADVAEPDTSAEPDAAGGGDASIADTGVADTGGLDDAGTTDSGAGDDSGLVGGPLPLTPTLCDDATNVDAVRGMMEQAGASSDMNADQIARMLEAPTEGPFYMVNLIHYRDQAEYADGRETDLTGREANALYSPTEFLTAIGARPVFMTEVANQIDGDDFIWDDVAVVEYPCPVAFFAMILNPDFQARAVHKDAGVEKTIVMVTNLTPVPARRTRTNLRAPSRQPLTTRRSISST